MIDEDARRARAEARRGRMWIHRARLGDPELASSETPEQRIELAAVLSRAAWAMAGQPMPTSGTARTVVRFVRNTQR